MVTIINKKRIFYLFILILVIILGCLFVFNKETKQEINNESNTDYHTLEYNGEKYTYNSSIVPILFIGVDGSDDDPMGQADTIDLALLCRDDKKIRILTIPRDTMCDIRTFDVAHKDLGWQNQHLALAYSYGQNTENGCILEAQAVSKILNGIPIPNYGSLNLSNLSALQNVVGQIELYVPNNSLEERLGFFAGDQVVINEENVEAYLRTRDTSVDYSDEARRERQKVYMDEYIKKLREMLNSDFEGTVKSMYSLLSKMTTNISLKDLEAYSQMLLNYEFDLSEDYYVLPGTNQNGAYHDEYIINQEELNKFIIEKLYKR